MADTDTALANATVITADSTVDYVIDKDLRTVAIPTRGVVLGVEGDKDVNTVRFECPRYYKGVDLMSMVCRVSYANANGDLGVCLVSDMADDDGTMSFTWLVSALAVKYAGTVQFAVGWRAADDEGNVSEAYNTTVGRATSLTGLETATSQDSSDYEDIVAVIAARFATLDTATSAASDATDNANSAADETRSVITAANKATVAANAAAGTAATATTNADAAASNANEAADNANLAAETAASSAKANANVWLDYDDDGYLCIYESEGD